MISLEQLRDWLLDESLLAKNPGRKQALTLFLDETRQETNAMEVIDRLSGHIQVLGELVALLSEKVMQSYQWDIYGYYPMERIEGPYDLSRAHQRMQELTEQTNRLHIRVIIGSEQEQHYQHLLTQREQQHKKVG